MNIAMKGFLAVLLLTVLVILNLSEWMNAIILGAFFVVVLFGVALNRLIRGA